jgi:hypothetical protein
MILNPMTAVQERRGPRGQRMIVSDSTSYERAQAAEMDIIDRAVRSDPGFADSVTLQTRWRTQYTPTFSEEKMDLAQKYRRLERDMWWELDQFLYWYRAHFEAVVANEMNNLDFFNGYQWSDTELRRMQSKKLIPHVSNFMARWTRTLTGEQRGAVTIPNFTVDDPSYKDQADLYNQVIPRIYRMNEWGDRSGDSFFNLSVLGRKFMSCRPDPYDPYRKILMRNERPQEFFYDIENAWDGTLDGCNYLCRVVLRDLEELIYQYPERAEELRRYDASEFNYGNMLQFTLSNPKVQPTADKRVVALPQRFINTPYWRHRRAVWCVEFYRRGAEIRWSVRDGNWNIDHDFPADPDNNQVDIAAEFYRNLRDAYQYKSIAATGQPTIDLVTPPIRIARQVVRQEIWCGRHLMDMGTSDGPRFPYTAAHNEFHMGEWRGFFQDDKSNQQIRNRMLVWWDMYLGNVKPKMFYHDSLFPRSSTQDEREEWLRDPNKSIIGKWNLSENPAGLVHHSEPPQVSQVPEVIVKFVEGASNFGNGGLNLVGDAEFAGQSNKMRQGLQVSAQTGTVTLFAEENRSSIRHAQLTVHRLSTMHPTVLLEYANPVDRPRFLTLLQNEQQSIDLEQIPMEIVEVMAGPSANDRQISVLQDMIQQDPENSQEEKLILLEKSRLPNSTIDRIKQARAQEAQAEGAERQHEQELAEFGEFEKWKVAQRRLDIEQFNADTKRNPPVQTSLQFKAAEPGPDVEASILEQNRIQAIPVAVSMSNAKQKLANQASDNLSQEEFNRRDLTHQKSLAKLYPKPTAGASTKAGAKPRTKSQGTSTPKDKSARRRKGTEKV